LRGYAKGFADGFERKWPLYTFVEKPGFGLFKQPPVALPGSSGRCLEPAYSILENSIKRFSGVSASRFLRKS
jgi:hypothetical protein